MLTCVDRVQVVVADRRSAVAAYGRLLGTAVIGEDRVHALAARRTVLGFGTGAIELLEPDGTGSTADFLSLTKGGLFAAGMAVPDIGQFKRHLQAGGVTLTEEGGQLLLSPEVHLPGLRAVISAEVDRPTGAVSHLYEVTVLVRDYAACVRQTAATFGLETSHFVPIRSSEFGYSGTLTLFHPDRLDRLEIVTPNDDAKTMGRFFAKRGPCLYMCFAEVDNLASIRDNLLEYTPNDWTGSRGTAVPDSLFIHPKALGGMMLGLSRPSFAWTWSGRPERVIAAARA